LDNSAIASDTNNVGGVFVVAIDQGKVDIGSRRLLHTTFAVSGRHSGLLIISVTVHDKRATAGKLPRNAFDYHPQNKLHQLIRYQQQRIIASERNVNYDILS
jgi:hypothetical protein